MHKPSQSSVRYTQGIEAHRQSKDEAFRYESGSPIDPHQRANFAGLAYFPADERWRLRARFMRLGDSAAFEMETSTGVPRRQVRAARLDMDTPAGPASLFAYKDASSWEESTLFVPFRDATSGKETYGAGRYLDLQETEGDEIVVDFNLAYNPYCAYSESYSCPLPPTENWLKVAVTAGEKSPPAH